MAIYVQLADRLLKVSNDVSLETITDALGYVPFNGEFNELKNSPFTEDNSGEYNVVDEAGNIILKINQDGVKTTKLHLSKGDVQEQIDGLGGRCSDLETELENLGLDIENISFESLKDNPITITEGEFIIMDDQDPANIGLKLNTEGLFVRDVYLDGNSVKEKLGEIDDTFLNVDGELTQIKTDIENLNSDLDNFKFTDLNDNPIDITGNEFIITDDQNPANVGFKLNDAGIFVKDVIIDGESIKGKFGEVDNRLSNLDGEIVRIDGEIENIHTEIDNISFENIKNNPIDVSGSEFIIMDDQEPSNVGLKLNSEGLFVKDVIIAGESVDNRLDVLDSQDIIIGGRIDDVVTDINNMKDSFTTKNLTVTEKTVISGETIVNGTMVTETDSVVQMKGETEITSLTTDDIKTEGDELRFSDNEGNTVALIDDLGISAFEVNVMQNNEVIHRLSEKANQQYVENEIAGVYSEMAANEKVIAGSLTDLEGRVDENKAAIQGLDNKKADKETVNGQISGVTQSLENHAATKATTATTAHVKLQSGDFKDITKVEDGVAASPVHTHSQYSTTDHSHGTITLSGDVTGSASIGSGSTPVNIEVTVKDDSHKHADYLLNNEDDTFDGNLTVTKNLTVTGTVEMGDMVLNKEEFIFTDENGIKIATIDDGGVSSTEFSAAKSGVTHKLTEKANQSDVNTFKTQYENHVATKATTSTLGHVTINSGDCSSNTFTEGVAAASRHSHGDYVKKSGDTITGDLTVAGTVEMGDMVLNKEEFVFADGENIIARINDEGVSSTDFTATLSGTTHKLTEKANQQYVENEIAVVYSEIETNEKTIAVSLNELKGRVDTAEEDIDNLEKTKADTTYVDGKISGVTQSLENHAATKATTATTAHVKLKSGDFKDVTKVEDGVAASPYHTHSQYLEITGGTVTGDLTVTGTVEMNDMVTNQEEFIFADESGYTITRIDKDGVSATEFTAIKEGGTHKLTEKADKEWVESHVLDQFKVNDAMMFKGTITTEASFPKTFQAGWTYKVATAGTYYGQKLEVGDLVIAVKDATASTTTSASNFSTYWTAVQTNTDGHVTGPASAATTNIAIFDGTSGKLIKDGGKKLSDLAAASHKHGTITLSGDVTGSATIGSGETAVNITATVQDDSHNHSNYVKKSGDTMTGKLTVTADLEAENIILNQNEYVFADASGNTVAKITADGIVDSVDFITKDGNKLSDCVIGPDGGTELGKVAIFADATGKKIINSGFSLGATVPQGAKFSDSHTTFDGHYPPTATTNSTTDKSILIRINKGDITPSLIIPSLTYDDKGHITSVSACEYDFPNEPLAYSSDITNIQTIIADNEEVFAAALTDINDRKLNISGGTVTGNLTVNGTVEMGDMVLNQSEYEFADENGNVIARINNDGFVDAVDFVTKEGKKLSECITSAEIAGLGGGDVVGPANATNERIAVFNGTTGKLIKDGGSKISDLAPKNHASTATTYGSGTTTNYGHVKLQTGDFSGITTTTNGVAASPNHTHGQYLPKSGGTMTGDITVNGSDRKLSNCIYDPTTGSTAGDVGSGIIPVFIRDHKVIACDHALNVTVPGDAVFTDEKVKATTTNSVTYYLLGHASTAATSASTAYKSSGVYVTEGSKVCASNGFFQTSDANLKNFHGDIPLDFELLRRIPKVYYSWKDDEKQTKYIGTSAQEVQKIYPELVSVGVKDELSVDYPKLTMVALKAVDVLYEENQKMKQEMEVMKKELELIKEKLGL